MFQVAIIESSATSSFPSTSWENDLPHDTVFASSVSSAQISSSRVTRQLYQFALGCPQTPTESSPSISPIDQAQQSRTDMGTFLFKWYVENSQTFFFQTMSFPSVSTTSFACHIRLSCITGHIPPTKSTLPVTLTIGEGQ